MKFSTKITSLVVLLAVVIIFIAFIGFFSLSRLSNQLGEVTEKALPLSHLLESISNEHTNQSLWLYQALLEAEIDNKEKFALAADRFNKLINIIDKKFAAGISQIEATLNATRKQEDRDQIASFLEQLKLLKIQHDDYVVLGGNVIFAVKLDNLEEAEESIQEIENKTQELNNNITALNSQIIQYVNNSTLAARQNAKYAINSIVIIALSALVLSLLVSFVIVRNIIRQLGTDPSELLKITEDLAGGKLKYEVLKDGTGIYASIRKTVNILSDTISGIKSSADKVYSTAGQVAQGNLDISQRTQEQASSLEEVASSMEQMTSTVNQNAANAVHANQLAKTAREKAEQGGNVADQAKQAMNEINTSSSRIADIISVIDEIAFQTNLLALNAAVEAARAGENGLGFAVVANEVRNLAGRCKTAAGEIKDLISDSVVKVEAGKKLVDESSQSLKEIVKAVKKVSDIVAEITIASQEQSTGIEQVNKAVLQMDEMTQQNASFVEQAAAASESMGAQAQELNTLVAYFSVNESGTAMEENISNVPEPMTDDEKDKDIIFEKSLLLTSSPKDIPTLVQEDNSNNN